MPGTPGRVRPFGVAVFPLLNIDEPSTSYFPESFRSISLLFPRSIDCTGAFTLKNVEVEKYMRSGDSLLDIEYLNSLH